MGDEEMKPRLPAAVPGAIQVQSFPPGFQVPEGAPVRVQPVLAAEGADDVLDEPAPAPAPAPASAAAASMGIDEPYPRFDGSLPLFLASPAVNAVVQAASNAGAGANAGAAAAASMPVDTIRAELGRRRSDRAKEARRIKEERERAEQAAAKAAAEAAAAAAKSAAAAAAAAQAAAAEEARKKKQAAAEAAAAAAAMDPGGMRGVLRAELTRLGTERERIYETASRNLLPCLLVPTSDFEKDAKPSVDLASLFSDGLKPVCEQVYGKPFTSAIAVGFSRGKDIRDFFEFDAAKTQCKAILPEGKEKCWICETTFTDPSCPNTKCVQDCEHKLQVVLALLLTGLYDGFLYQILIMKGLGGQYRDLLRLEYDYGHALCNRIKNNTSFIKFKVAERDKTVSFSPDTTKIEETLNKIMSGDYTKHDPPTAATILRNAGKTKATQAGWIQTRVDGIGTSLAVLIEKLNARSFTTRQLCTHFVNGLLDRAIQFAPKLTQQYIWERLTPQQQTALQARIAQQGARRHRRTVRTRRRSRRRFRGGAPVSPDLVSAVREFVMAAYLDDLAESVLARLDALTTVDMNGWTNAIDGTFAAHVNDVDYRTGGLCGAVLSRTFKDTADLLNYIYVYATPGVEFTPPFDIEPDQTSGPVKRTVSGQAVAQGGPMRALSAPAALSVSTRNGASGSTGPSTPMSAADASPAASAGTSAAASTGPTTPVNNPFNMGAAFGSPQDTRAAQAAPASAPGTLEHGSGSGSGSGSGANAGVGGILSFGSPAASQQASQVPTQQMEEGYEPPGNGYVPPPTGRGRRTRKRRTLRRQRVRT